MHLAGVVHTLAIHHFRVLRAKFLLDETLDDRFQVSGVVHLALRNPVGRLPSARWKDCGHKLFVFGETLFDSHFESPKHDGDEAVPP